MKIALLNLPVDNNYGGNLQRYALMKVLQDMGHDVVHINIRYKYQLEWFKVPLCYIKRFLIRYILGGKVHLNQEKYLQREFDKLCNITEPFYQKYIKHTEPISQLEELKKLQWFDAYMVGSDQVWRKKIAGKYLRSLFLDFLPKESKAKRIAYGVSLGIYENELSNRERKQLSVLYKLFNAVSVRERYALDLFEQYGWNQPQAKPVIDPTMLLQKEDYKYLIDNGETKSLEGDLFCYILDKSKEKDSLILQIAEKKNLAPFEIGLDKPVSIEQWLRYIADSKFIITDSYHGFLFSLLFNKPYYLIQNSRRGNARFDSIIETFGLSYEGDNINWDKVNKVVAIEREKVLSYISDITYG